ncbi:hypothetical protein HC723_04240 [Vibrio sp. S11_S32]|uniref:hypothetical protein n=1 Tax=Vibrio sp. S11_S32 TaxID=2720225 RepID=UPI001680B2BE|nr:hypothetical protein [Vibrio sp. S11_S32]MBD1575662.1 hypothetical protein [Vibrio sp. S11_S32]
MDYEVVFMMARGGLGSLTFAIPGLVFIAIGFFLIKNRDRLAKYRSRLFVTIFSWFFFVFAVLWTLLAGLGIGLIQYQLRSDYAEGNYEIVEGIVENFEPMPYEGHQSESFTVNGIKFKYSDFRVTSGFNNTKSHGGPIRENLPVRISYIGNTIIKLEVGTRANKTIKQD